MKKNIYIALTLLVIVLIVIYHARIGTGRYCTETPEVRWKFAIYAGECWHNGEYCHFYKIEDTGLKEYLGLAESELQKQRCYIIESH